MVLAADVLEHLRKPELVLSRLKQYSKRGSLLIVSLPNIANLYVRANLLFGRYPIHRKGLLDETHLHCFTLSAMRRLLDRTGWIVDDKRISTIPLAIVFPFLRRRPWSCSLSLLRGMTRLLPGLLAYQGIFFCHNPNRLGLLEGVAP